jgi:asparagine synthetase B (glutamine-hydrolysing)
VRHRRLFRTATHRPGDERADDGGASPARPRRRARGVLERRFARTDDAAPNGLLHTRLSIIDPRPEADQPMGNDAGDVWIAYNGEVYDWAAMPTR